MLKTIYIVIAIIIILIVIVLLDSKTKIFEKIGNKIKDRFDVIKYKRIANRRKNERDTANERIVELQDLNMKALTKLLNDAEDKKKLQEKIDKLKEEIKELRRVIAEDMTPKKKKRSK